MSDHVLIVHGGHVATATPAAGSSTVGRHAQVGQTRETIGRINCLRGKIELHAKTYQGMYLAYCLYD